MLHTNNLTNATKITVVSILTAHLSLNHEGMAWGIDRKYSYHPQLSLFVVVKKFSSDIPVVGYWHLHAWEEAIHIHNTSILNDTQTSTHVTLSMLLVKVYSTEKVHKLTN